MNGYPAWWDGSAGDVHATSLAASLGGVVTLERIKVAAQQVLPAYVAATVVAEGEVSSRVAGELILRLRAEVLGQQVDAGPITVSKVFRWEMPTTPWQAFKADHGRAWWLRWLVARRPVVMRTETRRGVLTVDPRAYVTWPDAPALPPSWGDTVQVLTHTHSAIWGEL